MPTQHISRLINAPRAVVYRALLDAHAVTAWRVPDGMTGRVHAFDPREGGCFRVSLTYVAPTTAGKTAARTDTYHGTFVKLVADREVVESLAFETADPAFAGWMTITTKSGAPTSRRTNPRLGFQPSRISPAHASERKKRSRYPCSNPARRQNGKPIREKHPRYPPGRRAV